MGKPPRSPVVGDLVLVLPGCYWPPVTGDSGRVSIHITVSEGYVGYVSKHTPPSNPKLNGLNGWMHVWLPGRDETIRVTTRAYNHQWRFVDLIDENHPDHNHNHNQERTDHDKE